jgi:hypothetical protein
VLRYRVASADGRRVEHNTPIGLVQKFPKDEDAWREIDRLGILVRINDNTLRAASGLTPLRSIISRPTLARMLYARSRKTQRASRNTSSAITSSLAGVRRLRRTSKRSIFSAGLNR